MNRQTFDAARMARALELARRGEGYVEPNPMVGCVIVRRDEVVGEGYHQRFGGLHAEREALQSAGDAARGATMYVTLEPCCHHGKTPPCTEAIVAAGIARVVVARRDPFPNVDGGGIRALSEAGIEVEVGTCEGEASALDAPYLRLVETGRPWVIAKWAMTLDGKIATHAGDSQWISNESSRAIVHQLRGRVDAILVGSSTARADDPLLTARPAGPRTATRIVLDSHASLSLDSQLVKTTAETPVLVVTGGAATADRTQALTDAGCEVLKIEAKSREAQLQALLTELGHRRMTNILVEGGGTLLGSLHDAKLIDEVHIFVAPKLVGGAHAPAPIAGTGFATMKEAVRMRDATVERLEDDIYVVARLEGEDTPLMSADRR
ncbi:MAG: riboflavin biosynthesis protein RibD [Planctomycetaceae bacterium]|nr:riboflavin biosynthesis protein RibD [Planctomycetaceae bacterium]